MRFVLVAAAKDVRRRLADPAALAIWIGIPLVLAGMLSFIDNTGGGPPRASVLLVDQDNTTVSRLLPGARLLRIDRGGFEPVRLEDTDHFRLLRAFTSDWRGVVEAMLDG